MPKKEINVQQYQENQNTLKKKNLVKKTKKIASTHAPTIGGALGFLAGGFGAGLTDGNPNTFFDVPVGISAGVGGAIMGTVLKQNYKSNSAEKKAKQQEIFLSQQDTSDIDDSDENEIIDNHPENIEILQARKHIKKRAADIERMKLRVEYHCQQEEMKILQQKLVRQQIINQEPPVAQPFPTELVNLFASTPMAFAGINKNIPLSPETINAANLCAINPPTLASDNLENKPPLL